jgi:hypothetical protein
MKCDVQKHLRTFIKSKLVEFQQNNFILVPKVRGTVEANFICVGAHKQNVG